MQKQANGYIVISVKSKRSLSYKERKKYLNSLCGDYLASKKGIITKFSNAIGYADVVDDYVSKHPIVIPAKVKTPDEYKAPQDLLFDGLESDFTSKGVFRIVVPIGEQNHPNSVYSYNHLSMCRRFISFIQKVYPELEADLTFKNTNKRSIKAFALDFFFRNLDFEQPLYTVEFASRRLLTSQELIDIYKVLKSVTDYEWHIEQFYCETCKSYHPEAPYHVEVVYD